ncbi:MAG: filamentous hemagglutinin N-terminal protein [Bradyrhizobium sp.]|nr:filamentous hemagglutinin N-terminal protein [Bradyrhizobium sp.]
MRHLLCSIAYGPLALALGAATPVVAGSVLPQGGSVVSGSATIGAPANNALTITQSSPNAVINWSSFSVGQPNTVTFNQPSSSSAILNRVTGNTPSSIAGTIRANGEVYLVNPNGIAITPSGTVNVGGGFVASTLGISNGDFMAGKRRFLGNGSSAAVSNAGSINVGRGGFVALLGGTISNEGTIKVPLGKVGLASGERVTLDLAGDGFMQVAIPSAATTGNHKALVDVSGRISAAGGSIELKAATVKQAIRDAVNVSGTLSARSVSGRSGAIVLGGGAGGNVRVAGRLIASAGRKARATNGGAITVTGHDVTIADNASIKAISKNGNGGAISVTGATVTVGVAALDASGAGGGGTILIGGGQHGTGPLAHAETVSLSSGATLRADATQNGNGGTIVVWSDGVTAVKGLLGASGAGLGNGGTIETSGHKLDVTGIAINASAPHGAAGTWLLDPTDLTVSNATTTAAQSPAGTWTSNSGGSIVLNTDVDTALNAGTNVVLQTSSTAGAGLGNLNVNAPIAWNANTTLTLTASNNININANITATGGAAGLVINPNAAIGVVPASGSGVFNLNNASVTLSGANPSLSIGGIVYTVINSLGTAPDATTPPATPTLQGVASANLAGHYALGSDIDAATTASWNGNTGFTPIGTVGVPFNGTFDGLGHSIANLTVNRPATADVGLFGSTDTAAKIRDVGLVGGSVTGLSSAGGLVGSNTGTIINSFNTGTVSGGSSLGGLMGSNTGAVSFSYATGNVNGTSSLGGLMGSNTGTVTNSYATGNVTGTSSLGGLMGSSTTGLVSNSYATGNVSGTSSVGGLMGSSTGPVTDTYATGTVNGTTSVGGLMGSSSGPVTSSYASGQPEFPLGTGLTSVQMKQSVNFNSWDFTNTWTIYNGLTNPLLRSFMTPLTVTANNAAKTYDGQAFSGGNGVTYSSPPNGNVLGTVNYGGTSQGAVNVGGYVIAPGGLYSNQQGYIISYGSGGLTVTAAPLIITANAQSRLYGAANPALTYVSSGLVNGDTLSGGLATTATTTSNVGAYGITQGSLSATSNYALSYVGANLSVTAAPLTVTANAQSRLYGAANPALTYVSSGMLNGDTLSGGLATTATTTSNVGAYGITQGTLANSNYAISYAGANLSVTVAPLTVTADAQSRLYGAVNPALTYVSSGLSNGDTLSGSLATTATTTSNVGAYGITQGSLSATSNYALSYVGANLSVTAAPLTVSANAQSRLYGAANPALTYLSSGLVNGDTLSGGLATTAIATSNVGAYGITQGNLAATSNYALSYIGANLNVTVAPLTVTANAQSRLYGAANPALTYVSSGLLNGDTLAGGLATIATTASSVGAYGITQGTLTATSNYALSYAGANLSVTAAPLTVTADVQSRIYGSANPTLSYTSSGLLNGDTLSGLLTTPATTTSNVGSYGITQGSLAATSNYTLSYVGANLAVTAAPLTVNANTQSRLYGAVNPALTYLSSGLVNGDSLSGSLATTATTTSNVGAYGITQGNLAATSNYALSYVGANLNVTAAPLTVTANAQSRLYGATNPALTYVSSGLINSDTLSGVLTTTATPVSNVGGYGITQGSLANSNYAISYLGANLTVTPAPLAVTADAQHRPYGAANPALTYRSSGLVNGDALSGGLATAATNTSNVGTYVITQGSLAASSNYVLSYNGANLSVTAAPLVVASVAPSPVFPSYFTPIDLVENNKNEDGFTLLDCRRSEPFGASLLDKACTNRND